MKNRIVKLIIGITLVLNLSAIDAFAVTLDAGKPNTPSTNDATPTSSGGKTPSSGGKVANYNPGSESYPYKIYRYTTDYCPAVIDRYNNFCSNTTNGSITDTAYRGTDSVWSIQDGNGDSIFYKDMYPKVIFEKWTSNHCQESNRTTDYYTWTASGPTNWAIQGGQFQTVTFTAPGKYTVTSVPHQTVTTESWTTTSGKAYDIFNDGHSKLITSNYGESSHSYTNKPVERTDLKRSWEFLITPEEVDIPITPDPNPPKPVDPSEVTWDVELIE